jgi:hypothetical protein
MNSKLFLAATAAAVTLTALPASAQFFSDYRPHTIAVREHARELTVDRADRLYWEMTTGRTARQPRCRLAASAITATARMTTTTTSV